VDWRVKAEDNALRIRNLFKDENVDVVINADETFVLFHMQDHKLIVPTGMKRVGTAAQVDNDKVGATVLIACEFKMSMIIPPMIIFTGVYGAKLMQQWEDF
jgi:predicted ATP-dependent Lon-type protease